MEQAASPSIAAGQEAQAVETNQNQNQPEQPAQPQKYKLKVHDKVVEKTIDELIKDAELGIGAHEKFREAKELTKKYSKYEQMEKALESGDFNPMIEKMGQEKFREFAENYLIDYLEYQQLSPEKKEALQYRQLYEQQKAELENKSKAEKEREVAAARAQAVEEIDREIAEVLKASGKQPKPFFVARIAENMLASLQDSSIDPSTAAKKAYERAQKSIQDDVSEYLSGMSVEDIKRTLPKELLDALRKSDVEAVRAQDPMRSPSLLKKSDTSNNKAGKSGEKVRMSTDEFFKQRIEKLIGA